MSSVIHPTAFVHPNAVLGAQCTIGPYCIIGDQVTLGHHNQLIANVILEGPITIGDHNTFHPFCAIGGPPQDLKYQGAPTKASIGSHNTIREYVTIHRGTEEGTQETQVGNHNLLMAYCHVAHDCTVGDHCVFANSVSLSGHVAVDSHCTLGGMTGIIQFCRVGSYAYVGGGSKICKDVPPFCAGKGNTFRVQGINIVGLRRKGFDTAAINHMKSLYHILITKPHSYPTALEAIGSLIPKNPYAQEVLRFCHHSRCGVYRNTIDERIALHPLAELTAIPVR